jgi:hypothetical protein
VLAASTPHVIVAHASTPGNDLRSMLAARGAELGHGGAGSSPHLTQILLQHLGSSRLPSGPRWRAPELRARLTQQGTVALGGVGAEFIAMINAEVARWRPLLAGIQPG